MVHSFSYSIALVVLSFKFMYRENYMGYIPEMYERMHV